MKRFTDYLSEHEGEDFNNSSIELSDDIIFRVVKAAWRKHRKETEAFVKNLADKDSEIKSILDDVNGDSGPRDMDAMDKKDEIVPPEADGSPGLEDGGGGE